MSTAPSTASSSPSGNENANSSGLKSPPGSDDDEIFQFDVNEKVFCYHGRLIYQARCLKREIRDNVPQYFVHYHGWNKNWDEWVEEDRIRAFTSDNIELYEKCRAQNPLKSVGKRSSAKLNTISLPTSSNLAQISSAISTDITHQQPHNNNTLKRKIDTPASSIDEDFIKKEEKTPPTSSKKRKRRTIPSTNTLETYGFIYDPGRELPSLPEKLKEILANDYHQVVKNQKIPKISIPSASIKTVQDVLDDYYKDRKRKEIKNESTVAESFFKILAKLYPGVSECLKVEFRKSSFLEFCEGLKLYFNSILETKLLYPIEQNLFSNPNDEASLLMGGDSDSTNQSSSTAKQVPKIKSTASNNNTSSKLEPCAIYSPIYLLRMLTKLDECLGYFSVSKNEMFLKILDILFKDFHEYLLLNLDNYFGKQNTEYVDVEDFQLIEELISNNNNQS